jgi:hypothetical protein
MSRTCLIVKSSELVPVPLGVVTAIGPVVASSGTVALILVAESTVNVADVPSNFTDVAPVRAVPEIVTDVPNVPLGGEKDEIAGAGTVTVKFVLLVSVPSGVVTLIGPVVDPLGTSAVIRSDESTVKVALVPWNFTAVAPSKFVPSIFTDVPTGPLLGENESIEGSEVAVTTKSSVLEAVPSGVVTEIFPVCAPFGTVPLMRVFETTSKVAEVVLNITSVAPMNPLPRIVTAVPSGPL